MLDLNEVLKEKKILEEFYINSPYISLDDKIFIEPNLFLKLVQYGVSVDKIFSYFFDTKPEKKSLVKSKKLQRLVSYSVSLDGKDFLNGILVLRHVEKPLKVKILSKKTTLDFVENLSIKTEIFLDASRVHIYKNGKLFALGKLIFKDGEIKVKVEEVYR